MSDPKRKSLVGYWSIRYFLVLIGSMVIVGLLTAYVIQADIKNEQHRGMQLMAGDLAKEAGAGGGLFPRGESLGRWIDDAADRHGLNTRIVMFILDAKGDRVQQYPPDSPHEAAQLANRRDEIMSGEAHIFKLDPYRDRAAYLVAVHPRDQEAGYVLLMTPEEKVAQIFSRARVLRLTLSFTVVLAGWGVIHLLMRRLIKPIREVADAAKQVVAGNYDVQLTKEHREREVHELMSSFKEMAERLSQLDSMRTQFMAGVTHELKTPVASISGLVQAVKEGVVSGREADEFLDICLKECRRLQTMVEDLLDFNSFAANSITVGRLACDLNEVVRGIAARWQHGQEKAGIRVTFDAAENGFGEWRTMTDSNRVEQIIVNLLNNARDAMHAGEVIDVRLLLDSTHFLIQVNDAGVGIPADEQPYIFEPFYRGKRKQSRVRGLGLGLPYSRLIARSLGGELLLVDSSPAGTTFMLQLPRELTDE